MGSRVLKAGSGRAHGRMNKKLPVSVSSCPVSGKQQRSCPLSPQGCLFPRHRILLKPWGHSGGKSRTGTEGEMRQLHSHPCSSPILHPTPHPSVNHQVCNVKISLGAVTNPECPGLTPDQLNQKSLAEEPRRAYFLVKSSGDSAKVKNIRSSRERHCFRVSGIAGLGDVS